MPQRLELNSISSQEEQDFIIFSDCLLRGVYEKCPPLNTVRRDKTKPLAT